jgi:hypothetical protein
MHHFDSELPPTLPIPCPLSFPFPPSTVSSKSPSSRAKNPGVCNGFSLHLAHPPPKLALRQPYDSTEAPSHCDTPLQSIFLRKMSSDTYDQQVDTCYDARYDPSSAPTNADVDGIAVAVTSES